MENNKPYFVVPYESVDYFRSKNGTMFSRIFNSEATAFDQNPHKEDFKLLVSLPTMDEFRTEWNYKGIVAACKVLEKLEDRSKDVNLFLSQMGGLIKIIENVRTMHVMKSWGLEKLEDGEKAVHLDKLMDKVGDMVTVCVKREFNHCTFEDE